jgi:MoxR-like ATPase
MSTNKTVLENSSSHLNNCISLKPKELVISDIKWKYLIRSVTRGKNILMIGPTGCAKTLAAKSAADAIYEEYTEPVDFIQLETLKCKENIKIQNVETVMPCRISNETTYLVTYRKFRPVFIFNCGSSQDARAVLIGNTSFKKDTGTLFNPSQFVKAIKIENTVIILDEITRAHHDFWNIIISVLDPIQRYLRLDEKEDNEVIKVAAGVTFIATANIGSSYTSTKIMDRALLDRFPIKIEMLPLGKTEEFELMIKRFNITDKDIKKTLNSIIEIAGHTREQLNLEDGKLTNFLSTRSVVEMTELLIDGFSLEEIAENAIYPNFAIEGGMDSERVYVKQLVQKYIPNNLPDTLI